VTDVTIHRAAVLARNIKNFSSELFIHLRVFHQPRSSQDRCDGRPDWRQSRETLRL